MMPAHGPCPLRGAFGNEYHGKTPFGRWQITKTDLLAAQAVGYRLRETSAFEPIRLRTDSLPDAKVSVAYEAKLQAGGGIPVYHWDVPAGSLPDGLSLDSFTGELRGTPKRAGGPRLEPEAPHTNRRAMRSALIAW
jgi:hypothetical protein